MNVLAKIDPDSEEKDRLIADEIERMRRNWMAHTSQPRGNFEQLFVEDLSYRELERLHLHYTLKNNSASIARNGLCSRIGANSNGLDDQEAIYFSYGLEAALHCFDVWLKWRLNRMYNPGAVGASNRFKLSQDERRQVARYAINWMVHMASRAYLADEHKIQRLFEWMFAELSNADYLALDLRPYIDYDPQQEDPKKECAGLANYAREIYGAGISTNFDSPRADKWNLSTPLGKSVRIPREKIRQICLHDGRNDAYSVLQFFYDRYLTECELDGRRPAAFALLGRFLDYRR